MYKSQFQKNDPCDWFCGHILQSKPILHPNCTLKKRPITQGALFSACSPKLNIDGAIRNIFSVTSRWQHVNSDRHYKASYLKWSTIGWVQMMFILIKQDSLHPRWRKTTKDISLISQLFLLEYMVRLNGGQMETFAESLPASHVVLFEVITACFHTNFH